MLRPIVILSILCKRKMNKKFSQSADRKKQTTMLCFQFYRSKQMSGELKKAKFLFPDAGPDNSKNDKKTFSFPKESNLKQSSFLQKILSG